MVIRPSADSPLWCSSLEGLAAANCVDRTSVGRMLRLTSLAPEIVERILNGNEPEGISLAKLRNTLPVLWVASFVGA